MKYLAIALLFSVQLFAVRGHTPNGFAVTNKYIFEDIPDATTTDATQTSVHTMAMPDPSAWMVEVCCEARKSDGSVREGFKKAALVYRAGGSATIEGSIVNMFVQPTPTYDMTFGVSGNDFQVLITGTAATTVNWRCAFSKILLE